MRKVFDPLSRYLRGGAVLLEDEFDRLKERIGSALRAPDAPAHIRAYRGFGNHSEFHLHGRLLRGEAERFSRPADGSLDNVLASFQRMESDEIPGVEVELEFRGRSARATTDEEGYFRASLPVAGLSPRLTPGWHDVGVSAELTEDRRPETLHMESTCTVLVPSEEARFGVISDIDDTVMVTGATRLLSMLRRSLLENAWRRMPFPGVAALYRGLATPGGGESGRNPFFYISSSPHNLYLPIVQFLEIQRLPRGPVLLRDLGLAHDRWLKAAHHAHKTEKVERVLSSYPGLPFVLIGDSGQHDLHIYLEAARRQPERIRAIWIRDVTGDGRHRGLVAEAERLGVPTLLADDSRAIAEHAAALGLVDPALPGRVADESAAEGGGA
jgi:phosphatidate phosphatase APP1